MLEKRFRADVERLINSNMSDVVVKQQNSDSIDVVINGINFNIYCREYPFLCPIVTYNNPSERKIILEPLYNWSPGNTLISLVLNIIHNRIPQINDFEDRNYQLSTTDNINLEK